MIPKTSKKVWVGMSGGVDSSVSALLLKKQGYDVTGVFIKVWQPDDVECTWKDERRDAMRICAMLDIPFLTLDLSVEYKQHVVDYMISEYSKGRTPNPDIMCNRHIKFGGFLDLAKEMGIDYVATGHYANVKMTMEDQKGSNGHGKNIYTLCEGLDETKDQSYFLWTLTSCDLSRILFPIGHLKKTEVRKIAQKNKLPVFDKKDSQGICFIGHVDMKEFLKKNIKTQVGTVLDISGNILGEHEGAVLYTVGERIGFKLYDRGTNDKPMYVLEKDINKNTVTVTDENLLFNDVTFSRDLEKNDHKLAQLTNKNWNSSKSEGVVKIEARVRYRQAKQACTFDIKTGRITFDKNQVLASGQSVVLYTGEKCLGGGIIS